MNQTNRFHLIVGCVLVCHFAGCKGNQYEIAPVAGKVVYQGQPLSSGAVMFHPENGPVAYAAIQADGTFQLTTYSNGDGAVLGTHHVRVVCTKARRPKTADEAYDDMEGPGASLIPEKYSRLETSGLVVRIAQVNEPLVFNLE
jgi:hypothetical protein